MGVSWRIFPDRVDSVSRLSEGSLGNGKSSSTRPAKRNSRRHGGDFPFYASSDTRSQGCTGLLSKCELSNAVCAAARGLQRIGNGMQSLRLPCRKRPYIRAEQLEEPIWREVKRVIRNPDLPVAGIDPLDSQESAGLEEEIAQAERDLRSLQTREDRAVTLFVSGRITKAQLDDHSSSSPSGLRTSERSWTITVPGRRAELRNYG